jgi:FtsH-binding integral membrane protein
LLTTVYVAMIATNSITEPEIPGGGWTVGSFAVLFTILIACGKIPCNGSRSKQRKCHKIVPLNFILLTLFTLSTSYLVGKLVSKFDPATVLCATAMTTAMVIGLSLFAVVHKRVFDLT